jgi:hypothetical protein
MIPCLLFTHIASLAQTVYTGSALFVFIMWAMSTDIVVGFLGMQPRHYAQLKTVSLAFDRMLRQRFTRLIYLAQAFDILFRYTKVRRAQRSFREVGAAMICERFQHTTYAQPSRFAVEAQDQLSHRA